MYNVRVRRKFLQHQALCGGPAAAYHFSENMCVADIIPSTHPSIQHTYIDASIQGDANMVEEAQPGRRMFA